MRRSAGEGRNELLLLGAAGASIATACGYPRITGERDVREGAGGRLLATKLGHL
jgi:hypothetical protein